LPRRAAHPAGWSRAAFFRAVRQPPALRAGRVCSGERRTARPPAWLVRRVGTRTSAAIPAAPGEDSFSIRGIRNPSVLPVPVWAVAITSFPSRALGMAAACTGVGVENRAAVSRSFSEGDRDNSEKLCILLSCWPELAGIPRRDADGRGNLHLPVFFLNYAENERRKRRARFSVKPFSQSGPHSTTDELSATPG
jgi:hypothetical protein